MQLWTDPRSLDDQAAPDGVGTFFRLEQGKVLFGVHPVSGADIETFVHWWGGFAKDARSCFLATRRIRGANAGSFRALNFAYATDGARVWTFGGVVPTDHAAAFRVCDEGWRTVTGHLIPSGFGTDGVAVFHENFAGRPKLVPKADAATFQSEGDGWFGRDAKSVFYGRSVLPKARPSDWTPLGQGYSRSGDLVFCDHRRMRDVDADSFEVIEGAATSRRLARDASRWYCNDSEITQEEFERLRRRRPA